MVRNVLRSNVTALRITQGAMVSAVARHSKRGEPDAPRGQQGGHAEQ